MSFTQLLLFRSSFSSGHYRVSWAFALVMSPPCCSSCGCFSLGCLLLERKYVEHFLLCNRSSLRSRLFRKYSVSNCSTTACALFVLFIHISYLPLFLFLQTFLPVKRAGNFQNLSQARSEPLFHIICTSAFAFNAHSLSIWNVHQHLQRFFFFFRITETR